MLRTRLFGLVRSISSGAQFCLVLSALAVPPIRAQKTAAASPGIAWHVKGNWLAEGKEAPIQTGDPVTPGALLRPDAVAAQHTIIVLLPDGQRVFYECFTVDDCARGFRVPALYRDPEPFAVDMLAHIRSALLRGDRGFSAAADIHPPLGFPRDEVVAVLGPDKQVHVDGLASKLPNGRFTSDIQPFDPALPKQSHSVLEKTGPSIILPLPSPGLYLVTIKDERDIPRMQLFLAAISPAQDASFTHSFHNAKELMQKWNDDFYGWPIHEFQWAYLESLTVDAQPTGDSQTVASAPKQLTSSQSSGNQPSVAGVAAEPAFSPIPGPLTGDTGVVLQSATPGATIHYTVDYSQPVASSPVYGAPIMIKGSGLTIKAFASAPGKKDSPVVTGTFRIRKQMQATK